ncbi:MAG: AraC family transcriptional regulator [Deltaproteobacteria bacterium]|nr:AraC family transcriptional regulator [Deltaproteobacteria bacterium]
MDEISELEAPPREEAIAMRSFAPCPALAPLVRCLEVVEARAPATRVLFPEPGLVLGFRYRGRSTILGEAGGQPIPDHVVTGIRATVRRMHTAGDSGIVVAKLGDGGALPFLRGSPHRLFGRWEPLDRQLDPGALRTLSARLREATGDGERVALVERFLLDQRGPAAPDPLALEAARALRAAHGALRIADLARGLHVSLDALEKRFRRTIGASPKQLASLLRLRCALEGHRPGAPLGPLALASGYCDQSHFVRALRRTAGEPPGAFLGRADRC